MMLKVGTGYLDFDGDIEIERKVKLFEDISTTDGDVSFSFDLQRTSNNMTLLGMSIPDASTKRSYQKIGCDILSDEGLQLYSGYLSIERMDRDTIYVAFYAGNSNWFGMLSGKLQDIDWSEFDQEQNVSNIVLSHSATEGLVFQVIDNSELQRRGYRHLLVEDFVASIYVKTVFKKIFQSHSIKIQGELLEDVAFNSIVTAKNGKSQDDLDAASMYATKETTLARPGENVDYKVLFDTVTVYPAYTGELNIMDITTSTITMPYKMRFEIEVILQPEIVDASYSQRIWLYINGAFTFVDIGLASGTGGLYNSGTSGAEEFFTLKRELVLEAGDTIEVYTSWQQSTGSTQNDVISGSIKITPQYIYSVFGSAIVPNWTQGEYVSQILQLFNVITSYDNKTATLTLNLFDKIKSKPAIDLSDYIEDTTVDYIEFISEYGKRSLFSYESVDFGSNVSNTNNVSFEALRRYNVLNSFKYGQGVIDVDNELIEDEADVIELEFANPIDYINPIFGQSMTKTNLLTLSEDQVYEITSVTDSSGTARFNLPENNILEGDLLRISESTNPNYNGDWVVDAKGTGYLEVYGLPFDTDATAKVTKLVYDYNDTDTVFLLWNIPFYQVTDISTFPNFHFGVGDRTFASYGYFSLQDMGKQVNTDFKQSLSFGDINDLSFYQYTILEIYWQLFARVLNDPVKLICVAYIPQLVFDNIDFMSPVSIRTLETTNTYYINKISGYKNSSQACELQLIKLP